MDGWIDFQRLLHVRQRPSNASKQERSAIAEARCLFFWPDAFLVDYSLNKSQEEFNSFIC